MPADGRALPGFYFDPEKGRYFAVQPNHAAKSESKYTKEKVATEDENAKKRKRLASFNEKRLEQTIKRSHIFQSVHSYDLAREIGITPGRSAINARTKAFCSGLRQRKVIDADQCHECGERDTFSDFAYHEPTNGLLCALNRNQRGRVEHINPSGDPGGLDWTGLAAFTSELSTINVTNSGAVFATTLESSHPGNIYIAGMRERITRDGHRSIEQDIPYPTFLSVGNSETTIWASAPNPAGKQDLVAVGESKSAHIIDTMAGRLLHSHYTGTDVRSVSWLNPILVVGSPNRKPIFLWDTRTSGTASRFLHKGGVTNVQRVNENQILVNGFASMVIYDLRMSPHRGFHVGHLSGSYRDVYSTPLIRLAGGTKLDNAAVAVDERLGLVARRDDQGIVQIHSTRDGSVMASIGYGKPFIKRLRFATDERGNETLMACQGSSVIEWTFGGQPGHLGMHAGMED